MFPKLVTIKIPDFLQGILPAELSIYSYGLLIALGIIVSFLVALKMSKKYGLNVDKLSSLFLWVIVASFVGGKVFFYLEDISKYLEDPSLMGKVLGGGFVFYGSLIFAIPTIIWWLRREKVPVRPFLDILAFVGPIVHSFGRIGCFMAGCCHGKACSTWVGVTFTHPDSLAEPLNTALYPTQLFDIAVNLIILATVFLIRKKQQFDGQLFLVYLIMYGVGRSIVEIYRGDEARGFLFGGAISHSQFIAILIILTCSYFWVRWKKIKA
jgi:phosphatidylglycerol:prolipoprotein diacylglycerol transferase